MPPKAQGAARGAGGSGSGSGRGRGGNRGGRPRGGGGGFSWGQAGSTDKDQRRTARAARGGGNEGQHTRRQAVPLAAFNRPEPAWTCEAVPPPEDTSPEGWKQWFEMRCDRIKDGTLEELQRLVFDAGRSEYALDTQYRIIEEGLTLVIDMFHPGKGYRPTEYQADVLYTMIFAMCDVITMARTGAGKSLLYHGYCFLTGLMVLQIIPLDRIGEEQKADIELAMKRTGSDLLRVCLLTADTMREHPDLLERIKKNEFDYVIAGPEMLASDECRKVVIEIADRIGMIAYDEVHLLAKWGDGFRKEFSQLYILRRLLRRATVALGASATISPSSLDSILERGGFRDVGDEAFQTKIIRASIDRTDITPILVPIPEQSLGNYNMLFFLLKNARNDMNEATPENIEKGLIFEDGRRAIDHLVHTFRSWLVWLTKDCADGTKKYRWTGKDRLDVTKVVHFYTSRVPKHDKDVRYDEYKKPDSLIRIMASTPSLSHGCNVGDIMWVVQWKMPISKDIDDILQKCGRAVRAQGLKGKFFWFYPWYLDDAFKQVPKDSKHQSNIPREDDNGEVEVAGYDTAAPAQRQPFAALRPSGLRNTELPGEGRSDPDQQPDEDTIVVRRRRDEDVEMTGVTTQPAATQFSSRNLLGKDWTQTEMERRDKTPHPIRYSINGKYLRVPVCFRAAQLEHYEDHKKMYDSEPVQLEECCGFHNPQLLELIKWDVEPPAVPKKKTPPTKGTKQAFVLPKLQFFFKKQAKASFAPKPEYNFENLLGELPYNLIIPDEHLWSLCDCIRHEALEDDNGVLTRKDIKETAGKAFVAWLKKGGEARKKQIPLSKLAKWLTQIAPDVYTEHTEYRAELKRGREERAAKKDREKEKQLPTRSDEPVETPAQRKNVQKNKLRNSAQKASLLKRAATNQLNQQSQSQDDSEQYGAAGNRGKGPAAGPAAASQPPPPPPSSPPPPPPSSPPFGPGPPGPGPGLGPQGLNVASKKVKRKQSKFFSQPSNDLSGPPAKKGAGSAAGPSGSTAAGPSTPARSRGRSRGGDIDPAALSAARDALDSAQPRRSGRERTVSRRLREAMENESEFGDSDFESPSRKRGTGPADDDEDEEMAD